MVQKVYLTYNDIHQLCQEAAPRILDEFRPQLMIAIGGGGYVPARILRSFLKKSGSPNIPIQAIGLSLYEDLPPAKTPGTQTPNPLEEKVTGQEVEVPGTKVTRTQWLDLTSLGEMGNLVGKNILIVDEVDDTRTTLEYAVKELEKDVEEARQRLGLQDKGETKFSIFVLHNKDKVKKGTLPEDLVRERYLAARTCPDFWICYPWEATDIEEHDRLAKESSGM